MTCDLSAAADLYELISSYFHADVDVSHALPQRLAGYGIPKDEEEARKKLFMPYQAGLAVWPIWQ